MTFAVGTATLYILSICLLSEKGQDVRRIFVDIYKELSDKEGVIILQVVKVAGENRIIAAVNVTDVCKLEASVEELQSIANLEITSEPVITYEDFGVEIGAIDRPISPDRSDREIRFFSDTFIEYYGNTTQEFNAVLRESVQLYLRLGNKVEQVYKHVAKRQISSFIFLPDAVELDTVARNGPLSQRLGSNVHNRIKGVQRLADYVASRNSSRGY